jgi:LAGLIDADG endonuclease.
MKMVVNMLSEMSITALVYGLFNRSEPSPMKREQFSRWLTGFIDGEGNFQVYLDRSYLRVMFRIRLHIDDIVVLQKIRDFLGVGRVVIEGSSCLFIISDVKSLLTFLFPLLNKYQLYTTKWLDYVDFKSVVLFLSESSTTRLSLPQLEWIRGIMSQMNLGRTQYNYDFIPKIIVNPFWLLGFIEAEGTFGFKNLSPYFQVGQHIRNSMVLDAIASYLQSLPKGFTFSSKTAAPTVINNLNNRTSVSVISIVNIDALYDYLMFFLLDIPFQTRKSEDFFFWSLALHLNKLGYFYLPEGRVLVYKISQYVNKGRYSTNPVLVVGPSLSEINRVLDIKLPVTLQPNMLHVDLAKAFAHVFKQSSIWVYHNGVLLSEEPFNSFASAMEAIGYSKTSVAARRSIDTGKIIGGCYTFYSKPL